MRRISVASNRPDCLVVRVGRDRSMLVTWGLVFVALAALVFFVDRDTGPGFLVWMLGVAVLLEGKSRRGKPGGADERCIDAIAPFANYLVVTSERSSPNSIHQIVSLGIYPERQKILVAKGTIAPRAAYEPVAAEIVMVDTPGATSVNPG